MKLIQIYKEIVFNPLKQIYKIINVIIIFKKNDCPQNLVGAVEVSLNFNEC